VRALWTPLALTLGAQAAALPWLLARFHALPWTSLLANLVAVPLSEGLLAAAALGALGEIVLPGSGRPWMAACEALAAALHALLTCAGAWPGALWATGPGGALVALSVASAALAALALARPRALDAHARGGAARAIAGVLALSCAAALLVSLAGVRALAPPAGRWWLVALDVGQGDATAIGTRAGWWLVDAGPRSPRWDAGEGVVLPFLRWAGVRTLASVCVTHDDGDHTGGLGSLRRGIPVRAWYGPASVPGVPGPLAHGPLLSRARGDTLSEQPGGRVLWPPRATDGDAAIASRGDNAASLVLELGEGAGRALLLADADSVTESRLAAHAGPALLKAGHHGSGSSSGAAFLQALAPARAFVSCGDRNPYGHPDGGALARLRQAGALLERTDHEGSLWYEVTAAGVRRLDWRAGEPLREPYPSTRAAGGGAAARAF
jgi:competence protein ComEC